MKSSGGHSAGVAHAAKDGESAGAGGNDDCTGAHGQGGPEPLHAIGSRIVGDHQRCEAEEGCAAQSLEERFDGGGYAHAVGRHQLADAGEVWRVADAGVDLDEHPDDEEADIGQGHGEAGQADGDAQAGPQHVRQATAQAGAGAVAGPSDGYLHQRRGEQSGQAHDTEQGVLGGVGGDLQDENGKNRRVHGEDESGDAETVGVQRNEGAFAPVLFRQGGRFQCRRGAHGGSSEPNAAAGYRQSICYNPPADYA